MSLLVEAEELTQRGKVGSELFDRGGARDAATSFCYVGLGARFTTPTSRREDGSYRGGCR